MVVVPESDPTARSSLDGGHGDVRFTAFVQGWVTAGAPAARSSRYAEVRWRCRVRVRGGAMSRPVVGIRRSVCRCSARRDPFVGCFCGQSLNVVVSHPQTAGAVHGVLRDSGHCRGRRPRMCAPRRGRDGRDLGSWYQSDPTARSTSPGGATGSVRLPPPSSKASVAGERTGGGGLGTPKSVAVLRTGSRVGCERSRSVRASGLSVCRRARQGWDRRRRVRGSCRVERRGVTSANGGRGQVYRDGSTQAVGHEWCRSRDETVATWSWYRSGSDGRINF